MRTTPAAAIAAILATPELDVYRDPRALRWWRRQLARPARSTSSHPGCTGASTSSRASRSTS